MSEERSGCERGRVWSAALGLAFLLALRRIVGWQGPPTAEFLANAALLSALWILWTTLVLAATDAALRGRFGRRVPFQRLGRMAVVLVAVAAPELGLRAHRLASIHGFGRDRELLEFGWTFVAAAGVLGLLATVRKIPLPRRGHWWLVGGLGLAVALGGTRLHATDAPADDAANVLIVVIDALRADALGCYGSPLGASPILDELADRGWRFDHAFSTATTSVPGHASILWGLEVPEHRALANEFDVPQDLPPSLPARLRERGYRTFGVCQNPLVSASAGFGRDFDHYWSWFEPDMAHADWREVIWEFAITRWWRELRNVEPISARARDELRRGGPWMGFVQFLYTHDPYEDRDHWANEDRVARIEALLADQRIRNTTSYPRREVAEFIARYHGALAHVDRLVGEILAAIPEEERARTLVVVTSDHGENLAEHGDAAIGKHFGSYQTSLRVPLIVTQLGKGSPAVLDELTGTDRIAEIVLALVDGDREAARERARKDRHIAYSRPLLMSIDSSTKLVIDGSDPLRPAQSYRWRDDPWDEFPSVPDTTVTTRRRLEELYEAMTSITSELDRTDVELRPEKLRRLRALGYID